MGNAARSKVCFLGLFIWMSAIVWVQSAQAQPPETPTQEVVAKVVEKMRAEKISASKAWDIGLLSKATLLYALSEGKLLDPGRNLLWNPTPETFEWAQLLIDKFPEVLQQPGNLDSAVRLRVALLLMSKRDARGVEMMEEMLAEMPRDRPEPVILDALIYKLSAYYRSKGDNGKALETTLVIREFNSSPADKANTLLNAARTTQAMGDREGAKKLYEEVAGYGYGWATGHAYSALAEYLFRDGKLEEGRALLKKPIEGRNADQIRVVLNQRLAQSYFETGEWDLARQYAKATVDQYNSLSNPIQNHGLEWIVESAKNLPRQIDQWKDKPVQVSPTKINMQKTADENSEAVHTYFHISSYRAITPKASSTDPDVKVWLLQSPEGYDSKNYRMMGIEISPAALKKELKAEIVVTVKEFPDVTFRIPITLQEPGARPEY
jgi:tetratricopeptide (TPR) repeat protein